jgi:PTH1 family peptidyl-tRNA hydrolase
MKIIVGLGNPGKEYQNSRHNTGFMVIDRIAQSSTLKAQNHSLKFKNNKKINAETAELKYQGEKIILVKPQTFMNESGTAVAKLIKFNNELIKQLDNNLWVIHDDLDLTLGKIKIVKNRGAAGHHGVESIINHLKTKNFVRFRIGISINNQQSAFSNYKDYVLGEFKGQEKELLKNTINRCVEAVFFALEKGPEKAMTRFNKS